MSRIAQVKAFERVSDENGEGADVTVDAGDGDPATVPHFADPGDDSQPLPGDDAALEDSGGSGGEQAVGYADTRNAGLAAPGEKRIYSRSAAGAVMAWVWLHADGSVIVENAAGGVIEMAAGGDVTINGVVIAMDGSVTAPGEVTAMLTGPGTGVNLSTHPHPTAVGPTGTPTPGV